MTEDNNQSTITAIKVRQWLKEWDAVDFSDSEHRKKPEPFFYIFSMPASKLRALSGINRRGTKDRKLNQPELGIQRLHEEGRSKEIKEFVRYGYPWSGLSAAKRKDETFADLRKPGWLPTSIVVNVLKEGEARGKSSISKEDCLSINDNNNHVSIGFPESYSGVDWRPESILPIEVIDGQHRLWAFEDNDLGDDYELPVVAFHGLDISWQAYLFWSINIKPKRINASLAYDLYPLLRTENWLDKIDGHPIYKETRAQELTEMLWLHPKSPWHNRINMLGETGPDFKGMVSQSAWIGTLMNTFVKSFEGPRVRVGGLYGAPVGSNDEVLAWSKFQQAAFLIFMGSELKKSIGVSQADWVQDLASKSRNAFTNKYNLLNTDQGIRGLLYIGNDLFYMSIEDVNLLDWEFEIDEGQSNEAIVSSAISDLAGISSISAFIQNICKELAEFDWRASGTPGLSEDERLKKAAFRGSGGYKELRVQLLRHLSKSEHALVSKASRSVLKVLGYNE